MEKIEKSLEQWQNTNKKMDGKKSVLARFRLINIKYKHTYILQTSDTSYPVAKLIIIFYNRFLIGPSISLQRKQLKVGNLSSKSFKGSSSRCVMELSTCQESTNFV